MHAAIRELVDSAARGWLRYGCIPCEPQIQDWGCQGCARPVVVLTFADLRYDAAQQRQYLGDLFLDECRNGREAAKLAAAVSRRLNQLWQQHTAGKAG